MSAPTELAVVLASALNGKEWNAADEIHGMLKRLGFEGVPRQKITAVLGAMCREDAPRFERLDRWGQGYFEYRLTRYAFTELSNRFDGLRVRSSLPLEVSA